MAQCSECAGEGVIEVEYVTGGVNSHGPWQGYKTSKEKCYACDGTGFLFTEKDCSFCDEHGSSPLMPSHTASPHCESGKKNHCTCDICY